MSVMFWLCEGLRVLPLPPPSPHPLRACAPALGLAAWQSLLEWPVPASPACSADGTKMSLVGIWHHQVASCLPEVPHSSAGSGVGRSQRKRTLPPAPGLTSCE